jgi:chromobox protein 1
MGTRGELVVPTPIPIRNTWLTFYYRETASKILNEYLASVGGKEAILAAYEEKKAAVEAGKKGKKRGRVSTGTTQNGGKKSKKNGTHPAEGSPPASSKLGFVPPSGTWEDLVESIEACEGEDGKVVVYLTWKAGAKTQHPLAQVYKRCPQMVIV